MFARKLRVSRERAALKKALCCRRRPLLDWLLTDVVFIRMYDSKQDVYFGWPGLSPNAPCNNAMGHYAVQELEEEVANLKTQSSAAADARTEACPIHLVLYFVAASFAHVRASE
jgi:hypothetical protein